MTTENKWIEVSATLPPEGKRVETKIDDIYGCRNQQKLVRNGRLWFLADGSMYVYYTPTHWRKIEDLSYGNASTVEPEDAGRTG